MVVCAKCKEEMKCTQTGRPLVWHNNHVYQGDEYTCPKCDNVIVYSNSTPYHLDKANSILEKDNPIDMDKK